MPGRVALRQRTSISWVATCYLRRRVHEVRVSFEQRRARAKERALRPEGLVSDPELLQLELARFFAELPEPPVYRRRDDPARPQAQRLADEGERLLASAYALGAPALAQHALALEAHLEALSAVADGRPEAAEVPWRRAQALEAKALEGQRLWKHAQEAGGPAYDRGSGRSRYDPRPEARFECKLICPGCRKVGDYSVSPQHAAHALTCVACGGPFEVFLGEVRDVTVTKRGRAREYALRLLALGGVPSAVEVADATGVELALTPKDRVALLYRPAGTLRALLNLTTSRVLWIQEPGACFIATAALGPDAPELATFRRLRDEVLLRTAPGRWGVRGYYRWGAAAAPFVRRHPALRRGIARALRTLAARLPGGRDVP